MLELVGRCGPAFGMIATLLGLIMMLGNLDDPDTIGPSMAVALIGTLYGAVTANLLCIPMTEKLSFLSHEEMLDQADRAPRRAGDSVRRQPADRPSQARDVPAGETAAADPGGAGGRVRGG